MKFHIQLETTYSYENPVSFSPHILRVFPRTDLFTRCEKRSFSTLPDARIHYRNDAFDNTVASCFFPEADRHLPFRLSLEIDVPEKNPFSFLLDAHALQIPPRYKDEERAFLASYLVLEGSGPLPAPLAPVGARPTVETLVNLTHWIHENIAYEERPTGLPRGAYETLSRGNGSCRDQAVLLAEVLRRNGVAARLVSGYLWEGDKPAGERHAESSLHMWTEAFLPGAGWIGLDPANGVLADHHFIAAAVGRTAQDVAPLAGSYYASEPVASKLESRVSVVKAG